MVDYIFTKQRRCKYSVKHDFFDNIDTEAKAYFLGYLYCDGNVQRNSTSVLLYSEDLDVLQKLLLCICPQKKICKSRAGHYVHVNSAHLRNALITLGVVPGKTYRPEFPRLPRQRRLWRHFVRGMIDADGSVGTQRVRPNPPRHYKEQIFPVVQFVNMCEGICDELLKFGFSLGVNIFKNRHKSGCWQLRCTHSHALKLLDALYVNATVYMTRKYNKALEALKGRKCLTSTV